MAVETERVCVARLGSDTWYPGGVGDDPYPNMNTDMGLTKADLLQLTASFQTNMQALINRTLAEGKFAWQLTTSAGVTTSSPAKCKADLTKYCQPNASAQHEAMFFGGHSLSTAPGPPAPPMTDCSIFGCTW